MKELNQLLEEFGSEDVVLPFYRKQILEITIKWLNEKEIELSRNVYFNREYKKEQKLFQIKELIKDLQIEIEKMKLIYNDL